MTQIDYEKVRNAFLAELKKASLGKPSSISFIRNILPHKPAIFDKTHAQALVIGGTYFETACAEVSPDGTIQNLTKRTTGTVPNFADAATFLSFVANHLDPSAKALAINLAYGIEPIGVFDGKVTHGAKEHAFQGLFNKPLVTTIQQYLGKEIPIKVANDTTCLTLAGTGDGLVVGSGFNIGIKVVEEGKPIVVNLEAGSFNKFEATEELEIIDNNSVHPGKSRFEKMLSGVYLPHQYNLIAQAQGLAVPHVDNGEILTTLAERNTDDSGQLARDLLERSAFLIAASLAAVYDFKERIPLNFTTEGSLFGKGWRYEQNVQKQLTALGVPEGKITFKEEPDSAIKGAFSLLTRIT